MEPAYDRNMSLSSFNTSVTSQSYEDYYDVILDTPFESDVSEFNRMKALNEFATLFSSISFLVHIVVLFALVVLDVYVIIVILKNEKLKRAKVTRGIVHFAVFSIIVNISYPLYKLLLEIFLWRYSSWSVFCWEKQSEVTGIMSLYLCSFALSFDWLINVRCSTVKPIYQKFNDHIFLIIYSICILKLITDYFVCIDAIVILNNLFEAAIRLFVIIFLLVCHCKRRYCDKGKNYPLALATIIVVSWIPSFICDILHEIFGHHFTMGFIIFIADSCLNFVSYGSSAIVVVWLCKVNKEFKQSFCNTCCFNCCKAKHSHPDIEGFGKYTDNENNQDKNSLQSDA
ncbi:uncharacterized protein LOC126884715 [Diabrotica virgifera virgifera]|uniref:G-protein coupled receptors family 1 profile domain-containing protein n=1 Tax=Diabrotica virgifera virgifera TaxID=50390 RepID=A0ABM5K9C9_DIAVI|nr:uncharacterized protein LOC126884715 [Diabrotica virgifera virgifera]